MLRPCAVVIPVALVGCTSFAELSSGYVHSVTGHPGRQGVGLQASGGYADGDVGIGVSSRVRITEEVQQLGVGNHLFVLTGEGPIGYGRLGLDVLQLGRVDRRFNVNVASPYLDVGLFTGNWLSVNLTTQYDWRLSDAGNDLWLGLFFGLGQVVRVSYPWRD